MTPWYNAALTRALVAERIDVRLVCPRYHFEPGYFKELGLATQPGPLDVSTRFTIRPAKLRQGLRLAEFAANMSALKIEARLSPPDILHVHQCALLNRGWELELSFLRSCKRAGVTLVHTVHNLLPHDRRSFHAELYAQLYELPDAFICHGTDAADALHKEFNVQTSRIHVVPHGPLFSEGSGVSTEEARRSLGMPQQRLIFMVQGVLAPYKGTTHLLQAWNLLIQRLESVEHPLLVIAGSGESSELKSLIQQIEQLKLSDSVRTDFGYIATNRIPLYFDAANVLVYPYRTITTSGALLTGLNYCKPIIASDLQAFRAYLKHGKNALLVPPDDVTQLTTALEALVCDRRLRDDLASGSLDNISLQMQWAEIASRTAEVYVGART